MKKSLFLFLFIFAVILGVAQNPVQWTFSAKKIEAGKYELHLSGKVDHPWHTYSQNTPEGGPLPTKITFDKNPVVQPEGKLQETSEVKTIHDAVFDVDVKFFPGDAEFVQVVRLKANVKTKITGKVEYMACDDHQCLPPKTIPFTIELQ